MSTDPTDRPDPPAVTDLQAQLERALIDEFLRTHGYDPANVSGPPNAELELLMKQACTYASGKLAEVEARAHFVHDIHGGVEDVHKTRLLSSGLTSVPDPIIRPAQFSDTTRWCIVDPVIQN